MKINDKVVFIGSDVSSNAKTRWKSTDWNFPEGEPILNKVYVIKGLEIIHYSNRPHPELALFLVGMSAINLPLNKEIPWPASWFKKLDDIKEENKLTKSKSVV